MEKAILQVKNLTTSFVINNQYYPAVDDVTFAVHENEMVAIVGESGCGKSALALSIMQLHDQEKTRLQGTILFKNKNLVNATESKLNKIRGNEIGMIFQEPLTALNPLMTIGKQIEENLDYHMALSKKQKQEKTLQLLEQVGINNPKQVYKQYPHELSGGMRQRVMISIAIACSPSLVIADEPTTALDVTIQAQIIDLLMDIQKKTKMGIIFITHDLSVVAETADRVIVMYAGQIVEMGSVASVFQRPLHPYTRSLLHSIPSAIQKKERLHVIQGMVPSLSRIKRDECRFKERIPWISEQAHELNPTLHEVGPDHFVRCTCYQHFNLPREGAKKDDLISGR